MTKNELIAAVAGKAQMTKTAAATAVEATFDAITSTLKKGGEVKIMGFGNFRVVRRAARDGRDPRTGAPVKIKAIANLSPERSASMPDIPTSDEGGVPKLYMSGWFGFFAPKGTPKNVIATLNSAMVQALAEPAVRARFAELGLDVASREQQTPEGLAAFQKAEIEKWWPIIKEAGIQAQ